VAHGLSVEIAPVRVTLSDDRKSCRLEIDAAYARERLDETDFDLFLCLRCDYLVDDRGHAVDGNLLARWNEGSVIVDAPTGDGVPGGAFESWIQVRMKAPKRA
jgi:hypothetical protein